MFTYTTNLGGKKKHTHTHIYNMSIATHADLTHLIQPPNLPGLLFEAYSFFYIQTVY